LNPPARRRRAFFGKQEDRGKMIENNIGGSHH
jgi:hypothetical protein